MLPPYYLSAYTIAKNHGFQGTEDEWLRAIMGTHWYFGTEMDGNQRVYGVYVKDTIVGQATKGDFYLSKTDNTIHVNIDGGGTWDYVTTLSGGSSSDGNGIHFGTVVTGNGDFAVSDAKVGDVYFNTSSNIIAQCTAVSSTTSTWSKKIDSIGVLANLTTTEKSSIVGAINELVLIDKEVLTDAEVDAIMEEVFG